MKMIANNKTLFNVFLFVFLLKLISAETNDDDDIRIIRQRILNEIIWPTKENLPNITFDALSYTNTLNSSCYWPDIDYQDQNVSDWSPYYHMQRVTIMFQALTAPDSPVQNDTNLSNATRCALNVWLVNDWQNPNWWFNQIGIPRFATSQLMMLGDNATEFEREKMKNISYCADWWIQPEGTGANFVSMLVIQLYRSLATNNLTGVDQAFPLLWGDINILPPDGQGIQHDLSYHFHGLIFLSGSYGQEWAVALLITIVSSYNTRYQIDEDRLLLLARFLSDGDVWLTIGDVWDWQVLGRHIDRPNLERLTFITPDWIRSFGKLVTSEEIATKLFNWADRLEGRHDAVPLIGNKHFFNSDYQVHRRANWSTSLKLQSIRTTPTECIIGENKKAEHLGQGVLNLWTNNSDDYVQIFPLFDWQAINGITVERDIPLESCDEGHFSWIMTMFVGGASDGEYGLAVMDTKTHNLTAQRSWHFYDDAIIALATNLTLTSSNSAWTTLASRLLSQGQLTVGFFNGTIVSLSDGRYSFPYIVNHTSNVQWFHVGESNIGYLLETQGPYSSLGIDLGVKTNNYDSFGPFNYEKTGRMLTAWVDHGVGPYTLDYQYIVLPNVAVGEMSDLIKRYEDEKVFSCISTNELVHGTAWPSLKRASFVLWENVSALFSCESPSFQLTMEVSNKGIFLFNETDTDFSITASHPTHHNISIAVAVTVNRVGSGDGCVIQSHLNPSITVVTLQLPFSPVTVGKSVTVTCKKVT